MKTAVRILLLLAPFLVATLSVAQTPIKHVIVVIQENRTPENLFNQSPYLQANAHVQPGTLQYPNSGLCKGNSVPTTLTPTPLWTCWDPDHSHRVGLTPGGAWETTWDSGGMDGACNVKMTCDSSSCPTGSCTANLSGCPSRDFKYCSYTYVANTTDPQTDKGVLDPYFQIAQDYGYANFMFQTSQGPSFPAHQFLFSGTSAPDFYNDPTQTCDVTTPPYSCWEWFDAENVYGPKNDKSEDSGCLADQTSNGTAYAWQIDPAGNPFQVYTPPSPVNTPGFPCYNHNTLADVISPVLGTKGWRYYAKPAATANASAANLWTAPAAFDKLCVPSGYGPTGTCTGTAFTGTPPNVILPFWNGTSGDAAPILTDIENCNLAPISYVIPDGNWSDHADTNNSHGAIPGDGGPSWVGNIVNAIGNSQSNKCGIDYWGYLTPPNKTAEPTVILVVWDDWGGYYDDVPPPDCSTQTGTCSGYFNSNNSGQQYVYGFRVPLLVISAYATPGYISGAKINPPITCPNYYCHDFGSILNFIEHVFGLGEISPNYQYADHYVMDKTSQYQYSLWDFFGTVPFSQTYPFQSIGPLRYDESCFHQPTKSNCFSVFPLDPDNDANESQTD